jgi:hypothetical protein
VSEKALFAAACLTALLALTVLVALGEYASSVTEEGARRTLARAPVSQTDTRITARVTGATYGRARQIVREGLAGRSCCACAATPSASCSSPSA